VGAVHAIRSSKEFMASFIRIARYAVTPNSKIALKLIGRPLPTILIRANFGDQKYPASGKNEVMEILFYTMLLLDKRIAFLTSRRSYNSNYRSSEEL